jgi:hypothetical protein
MKGGKTGRVATFDEYRDSYTSMVNLFTNKVRSRRDTIMVEKGWTVVIAVKATNAGIWVSAPPDETQAVCRLNYAGR